MKTLNKNSIFVYTNNKEHLIFEKSKFIKFFLYNDFVKNDAKKKLKEALKIIKKRKFTTYFCCSALSKKYLDFNSACDLYRLITTGKLNLFLSDKNLLISYKSEYEDFLEINENFDIVIEYVEEEADYE